MLLLLSNAQILFKSREAFLSSQNPILCLLGFVSKWICAEKSRIVRVVDRLQLLGARPMIQRGETDPCDFHVNDREFLDWARPCGKEYSSLRFACFQKRNALLI